jgi:hypothetical protein
MQSRLAAMATAPDAIAINRRSYFATMKYAITAPIASPKRSALAT